MDSNSSSYVLNHGSIHSLYGQGKEDDSIIDLGLSLRALQPEVCYSSGHGIHEILVDWQQLHPQLKTTHGNAVYPNNITERHEETTKEIRRIQRKERLAYVKVNMDGVIVGRKICISDEMGYSSLALQLEDMFGKQTPNGLRLFQADSEFSLLYKDKDEEWRSVGDAPWTEFVDQMKRLRIVRKDFHVPSSLTLSFDSL